MPFELPPLLLLLRLIGFDSGALNDFFLGSTPIAAMAPANKRLMRVPRPENDFFISGFYSIRFCLSMTMFWQELEPEDGALLSPVRRRDSCQLHLAHRE